MIKVRFLWEVQIVWSSGTFEDTKVSSRECHAFGMGHFTNHTNFSLQTPKDHHRLSNVCIHTY